MRGLAIGAISVSPYKRTTVLRAIEKAKANRK